MFRLLTISLAIVGGCGGQVTEDTPPASKWQRIDTIKTQPVPVVPEIVTASNGQRLLRRKMDGKKLSAVHSVGSNRAGQTDSSGHRGRGYRLRQSSERGEAEKVRRQKLAAIQRLSAFDEEANHSLLRIHDGGFTAGIDQGPRETTSGGASWQHCSGCGLTQIMGAEQLHLQPAAIVGRDATGAGLESSC
jgi:hypothetical protein